jgi:hypothetical protein
MPLVKYGFGISDIRGSSQGTTFSRCSSGNIFYRKPHIVNKRTALQIAMRQRYFYYCSYWKNTQTVIEKTRYNNLAMRQKFTNRLGDTFYLSGCNMLNFLHGILTISGVPIADGFANALIADPTKITITAATTLIAFATGAFTGFTEIDTSDYIIVYCSPPTNEKQKYNDRIFRYTGYSKGAGGGGGFNPASLTVPWRLTAGLYLRIKIKHWDSSSRFWEELIFQKVIV